MSGKIEYCPGCRDDFYNGQNRIGVTQCWSLKSAKVVTRYRLGWWTAPTAPGAFTKVTTNSCHYATGRYAHYTELPDFVTADERSRVHGQGERCRCGAAYLKPGQSECVSCWGDRQDALEARGE
jgi:hypothetical protein